MSNLVRHSYHLVDESPWPILSSFSAFVLVVGLTKLFCLSNPDLLFLGMLLVVVSMTQWWRDVSAEGSFQGLHSAIVELGLRWGMVLFIVSEIFFFVSFFWAFFHSSLSPSTILGGVWPPMGVLVFSAFEVPLLNTMVLLGSGVSVTYAHHSLMAGNHRHTVLGLCLTIVLGVYFSLLQGMEYWEASFSISDSVYGSSFFLATGFHGLHVLVGSLFLLVCYYRLSKFMFSGSHHFGFEAAAWYWHFVDVVWLFLFVSIYWWGGLV